MSVKELYELKKSGQKIKLKHKDIDLFRVDSNIDLTEFSYLLVLADYETNKTILAKVEKVFSRFDVSSKKKLLNSLVPFVDEIDISGLLECISYEDFDLGMEFFSSFISSEKVSCTDKFILFDDIVISKISEMHLNELSRDVTNIARKVLLNDKSLKGEVRQAVRTLDKIGRNVLGHEQALNIIEKDYKKNEVWNLFYEEELKANQDILLRKYEKKVSEAFSKKDYNRVIRLIGEHENKLPRSLENKLKYSKKKCIES